MTIILQLLYQLFYSVDNTNICKGIIKALIYFFYTMEVNGYHQRFVTYTGKIKKFIQVCNNLKYLCKNPLEPVYVPSDICLPPKYMGLSLDDVPVLED